MILENTATKILDFDSPRKLHPLKICSYTVFIKYFKPGLCAGWRPAHARFLELLLCDSPYVCVLCVSTPPRLFIIDM